MEIGDKVKIIESQKDELIELYKTRRGLSGVNPKYINDKFKIEYFDGSNIVVINFLGKEYSLNKCRFELCSN